MVPDMANEDDKPITIVEGDGTTYAKGLVEPTKVTQAHPCFMCRSFDEVELGKMIQHLTSTGGAVLPDGRVQAPRPKDIKGEGMILDPRDMGFCRKDSIATDKLATCGRWEQKRTFADFRSRRGRR